ncbi:alcohol oxidase [Crucibulum laeve]|uniref:pyranose dehydrogenase (acceptor) n=1 Tax=Crucibulum laeve TaxID=68775 RepID=A0A5C3LR28_9AGAR|nr:alcohol oxidase [Crucibulum laeve]
MWPFSSPYPEIPLHRIDNTEFDYIIIGGGTAGCCLASRLSENLHVSVLLLERGPLADTWASRVPLMSADIYRQGALAAIWPISPMINAHNRVVHAVIGEGLGGGSRINSIVYTRGIADYNKWKDMGHSDWGYDEVEPFFMKSETAISHRTSRFRGNIGPLLTRTFTELPFTVLKHVNEAAKSIGIPEVRDVNSPDAPIICCANMDVAIDPKMRRHSTFRAFLPKEVAVARNNNLKICTEAVVTRIDTELDASSKLRATSVQFQDAKPSSPARTYKARAKKEIILCAGAIANPQILMLSGIGPSDHLREHSIKIAKDLPGVGSYLKDHMALPIAFETPLDDSLHVLRRKPLRAIKELLNYLIFGCGLFVTPFLQSSIFVRSSLLNSNFEVVISDPSQQNARLPENIPDIEIMPIANRCIEGPSHETMDMIGVFSFLAALVKPKSSGTVRLASTDPHARAIIELGYLTDPEDNLVLRKAVRFSLRLAEQVVSQGYPLKPFTVPASNSDADIDEFIRQYIRTTYHYTSTCRMAPEKDPRPGVVDDELRVHGISGLRIADTSIFPDIVATHTMAPAVMVAEKCATYIKKSLVYEVDNA